MIKIRSVSGHVSPLRYLRPTPFAPSELPDLGAHIGVSRLPIITASFLAIEACREVLTSCAPMIGSPWLSLNLNVRLDAVLDLGETMPTRQNTGAIDRHTLFFREYEILLRMPGNFALGPEYSTT